MRKVIRIGIVLLAAGVMLAGCMGPKPLSFEGMQTQAAIFAQATLTRIAFNTLAAPTNTAESPLPTQTPAPPISETQPPTPTVPSPTETSVPTVGVTYISPTAAQRPVYYDPIRLSFSSGATNLSLDGSAGYNSVRRYVFWAAKDQYVRITLSSAGNVVLGVSGANGAVLLPLSEGRTTYAGYLKANGDWYIDAAANPQEVSFTVYLEIPERVNFPSGAYSLTANGKAPANGTHEYLVWANKGQRLKVSAQPGDKAWLAIYHVDGTELLSASAGAASFDDVLPKAGDYVIRVLNRTGSALNYSLPIEIK